MPSPRQAPRHRLQGPAPRPSEGVTMIDFEIPEEYKALAKRYRAFVKEYCVPAEEQVGKRPLKEILKELHGRAKAAGLWCPHMPEEWGGLGLGPLVLAGVPYDLGGSRLADRA